MEGKRLGRGDALRQLIGQKSTLSGRTIPHQDEEESNRAHIQPPRPAGRSALFANLAKPDPAPPQMPLGGRGRALLSAAKGAATSPEVDALVSGIKRLSPGENVPVPEEPVPNYPVIQKGSTGREVAFTANYVRLNIEEGKGVFQYSVLFEPPVDSKGARFSLLKQCTDVIGETRLFDGAVLYLPFRLPQKNIVLSGSLQYDNTKIQIIINYVCQHNFGDQSVIHLYNILFRRIMILLGMAEHGTNFYDPKTAMPMPLHKLEVWPGYVTAIDEYEDGLMLCCDASHRVLRNQTVLELLQDLENSRRQSWKDDFCNLILGQTVLTRYNNKVYRVDDVSFNESPMDSFEKSNGEKMTYITYYRQQYSLNITEEHQPLLKSKPKKRMKGQENHLVSLIPELCYLTGITDEMRADLRVMKDITQCICINPQQRMYAINKYIKNVKGSREAAKILADWGLSLDHAYVQLPGRVLPPVDVFFGEGKARGNAEANWSGPVNKNKALTTVEIIKWSVICTKRDEQSVTQFIDLMQKFSSNIGLRILRPKYYPINDDRTETYIRSLRLVTKSDDQVVMVVLPLARNDKYGAIKKICCVEQPIPSQVMLSKTIRRGITARAIILKVAHQINCKLGGTSWSVHIPLQSTMVCGLDSYHDPKRKMNSVGALVSSLNQELTRWYSRVFFQPPGYEFVDGLVQTMSSSLTKWREVNGMYPDQIIFYRDGVSDGQLKTCREHEIPQIRNAFKKINPGYNPKFLLVITQKRINTRYFLTEGNQYTNPPAGSILDHTVTRRYLYDFFLVSQHVTQGTVSPTHYIVLHNTTNMNPDQVQRLSYTLTHLYYNWPGTIRVPAPCQYAHKLAYLVGENIHKEASEVLCDKLFYL